jgi:hypothetical protein
MVEKEIDGLKYVQTVRNKNLQGQLTLLHEQIGQGTVNTSADRGNDRPRQLTNLSLVRTKA